MSNRPPCHDTAATGQTSPGGATRLAALLVLVAASAPWPFVAQLAISAEPPRSFTNSLGLRLLEVKGKRFQAWTPSLSRYGRMMGDGGDADVAFALNRPRVTVPVELPDYWLSEFPVTNQLYREFVEATGYQPPSGKLVSYYWQRSRGEPWKLDPFQADNLPVTGVNDADLEAFCQWLSKKEGRRYRAPTIYEFEFANRAGTDTNFWWGDLPDVRKMNYGPSLVGHPTPVGAYPPNPWGFYGMHGNVWQYCHDQNRYAAMGGAFNCPPRWTGADAWGNFAEGPHMMRLLTSSFRLACDADQGVPRPGDLAAPRVKPASGQGVTFPELTISVGEPIDLGPLPTNAAFFMTTRAGTWILNNRRSTDRGQTWQPCETIGEAFCQLADGTILAVPGADSGGGRVTFASPLGGQSALRIQTSRDEWKTVETHTASIHVPLAEFFLAVRGLIELDDGRLLMTMYGRMNGDRVREDSPVGFELDNPWIKTRVILVESTDRGRNWQYRSTISYNPQLGFEGQNESDLIRLPNGLLAVFMRTGIHGYVDRHGRQSLDQPLLMAWSADQGSNWSEPRRIHVGDRLIPGIYPRVLLTEQNVLAVLRCRPDGSVIFSPDGSGSFWSDEQVHYRPGSGPEHAGMQDMALIGPHTMLVIDIVRDGNWRARGIPITVVRKDAAVDSDPP